MEEPETVLDLDDLRIDLRARPSHFDRWYDCRGAVTSQPFAGVVETIFTNEDLLHFADSLDKGGTAVLGGGRAPELRLDVQPQEEGIHRRHVVEGSLTPSSDDPYPLLRFLLFDVQPFAHETRDHLRRQAAIQPWPTP